MAISDKLTIVNNGCEDIRSALKEFNPNLGAGHINTLDDDVRAIYRSTLVLMDNPKRKVWVLNNGTTINALSSNSNVNVGDVNQVILADRMTTIAANCFKDCTNLTEIDIPTSVSYIGTGAFANTGIKTFEYLTPCQYFNGVFNSNSFNRIKINNSNAVGSQCFTGCGTTSDRCTIIVGGEWYGNPNNSTQGGVSKLIILGDINSIISAYWGSGATELRIKGNCTAGGNLGLWYGNISGLRFFEVLGNITTNSIIFYGTHRNVIAHLGYNGVITANPETARFGNIGNIYVGPGNSQAEDEAILNQYLANSNWANYTSKLATWWSYKTSADANPSYLIPIEEV